MEEHACGGYLCALWLRICTGLHIEKLQFANSPFDARAWELIETGKLFREKGVGGRGKGKHATEPQLREWTRLVRDTIRATKPSFLVRLQKGMPGRIAKCIEKKGAAIGK